MLSRRAAGSPVAVAAGWTLRIINGKLGVLVVMTGSVIVLVRVRVTITLVVNVAVFVSVLVTNDVWVFV